MKGLLPIIMWVILVPLAIYPIGHPNPTSYAIFQVAARNDASAIRALLCQSRTKIDQQDSFGRTALHLAVHKGNIQAAQQLVGVKANVELSDKRGNTPLMIAAAHGLVPIAKLLIQAGADTEHTNTHEQTPLIIATISGRQQLVRLLVTTGTDIDHVDKRRYTAVFWAASLRRESLVRYLLKHGAAIPIVPKRREADHNQQQQITEIERIIRNNAPLAYTRSTLIERELHKTVPRELSCLIRQFETIVPGELSSGQA